MEIVKHASELPPIPTNEKMVGFKEATRIVPLAETTLRIYVSRRKIPFYKIGSRVFFKPSELREWIEARHVPAAV